MITSEASKMGIILRDAKKDEIVTPASVLLERLYAQAEIENERESSRNHWGRACTGFITVKGRFFCFSDSVWGGEGSIEGWVHLAGEDNFYSIAVGHFKITPEGELKTEFIPLQNLHAHLLNWQRRFYPNEPQKERGI